MRSFEQFITEERGAPLYHGTNVYNAESILRTGIMRNQTIHTLERFRLKDIRLNMKPKRSYISPNPHDRQPDIDRDLTTVGFSTTRDFKYACKWGGPISIVFEFNQQALVSDYKVRPFNYWYMKTRPARGESTESEEFVVTPRPMPIYRYLKRYFLVVYKKHVEEMRIALGHEPIDYQNPHNIIDDLLRYQSEANREMIKDRILRNRYYEGIKLY